MNTTLSTGQQPANLMNRKILVARRISQGKKGDNVNSQLLVKWFEAVRKSSLFEPAGDHLIHVRIHYPSGSRSTFKFKLDSSLEKLFEAACRNPDCPMYFRLFATYPKTYLPCAPEWYHKQLMQMFHQQGTEEVPYIPAVTFHEAGFPQTITVMVEDCGA